LGEAARHPELTRVILESVDLMVGAGMGR
jgi:hypothetical protein